MASLWLRLQRLRADAGATSRLFDVLFFSSVSHAFARIRKRTVAANLVSSPFSHTRLSPLPHRFLRGWRVSHTTATAAAMVAVAVATVAAVVAVAAAATARAISVVRRAGAALASLAVVCCRFPLCVQLARECWRASSLHACLELVGCPVGFVRLLKSGIVCFPLVEPRSTQPKPLLAS